MAAKLWPKYGRVHGQMRLNLSGLRFLQPAHLPYFPSRRESVYAMPHMLTSMEYFGLHVFFGNLSVLITALGDASKPFLPISKTFINRFFLHLRTRTRDAKMLSCCAGSSHRAQKRSYLPNAIPVSEITLWS